MILLYDNDHVPTPPPLFGDEVNLLVIGDTMAWIPAFVVPAIQNLVIGEEDDSNEGNHQFQGEAESGGGEEVARCRSCSVRAELQRDGSDCRSTASTNNRRE